MLRNLRILLLGLLLLPYALSAVEVSDLYVARVDAKLNTNEGLVQGFEQVVIRASGQRNALVNPLISQQRNHLKKYIGQYGYIEDDGKRWLQVTFNQENMERLLKQANLPIWGSLRPLTLVWLVQEENYKRSLVSESSLLLQQAKVKQLTQERGVPIILPLLDLEDISLVDQADVWGLFTNPVQQASARYEADQIVLAKLFPISATEHQLQWTVYPRSSNLEAPASPWSQGQLQGELPDLMTQWWHQLSDTLGERFATQSTGASAGQIEIVIYNLTDLERVLAAEKSLQNMAMVSKATLKQVDASQAIFSIQLIGEAKNFFEAIQLDSQLEPLELLPSSEPDAAAPLPSYMWRH